MLSVKNLIFTTKRLEKPVTLAEQILCECRYSASWAEDYLKWSMVIKEAFQFKNRQELSDKEWNHMNIWFFNSHRFLTNYAQRMWGEQKLRNLNHLKEKVIT